MEKSPKTKKHCSQSLSERLEVYFFSFLQNCLRKSLVGTSPSRRYRQKPLSWKVSLEVLCAAETISCMIPYFSTDRNTERRRPNLRLHYIRYPYTYSYFSNSPLSPNGFHWEFSHVKPPVSQQQGSQTGQTLDVRPFTTHKKAYYPKIKPKMTLVLNVARVQLKHNSSVTQHVVSRAMESVATYALRQ